MLLAQILQFKLTRHGLGGLYPGKAPVIQAALLQPVTDDPAQILLDHRRHLDACGQLFLRKGGRNRLPKQIDVLSVVIVHFPFLFQELKPSLQAAPHWQEDDI